MSECVCEFCDATFSKPSNLKKHQLQTKRCLQIQEDLQSTNLKLTCEYCGKVLSRSDSLHRHHNVCVDYLLHQKEKALQDRLAEKDAEITDLKKKLWELTNTAVTTPKNHYTHIDHVTINNGPNDVDALGKKIAEDVSKSQLMLGNNIEELVDELCQKVLTNLSQNRYLLD